MQLKAHAKLQAHNGVGRVTLGYVQAMVYSCLAINDPSLLAELGDQLKVDLVQLNRRSQASMAEASSAAMGCILRRHNVSTKAAQENNEPPI